jgi:hypothetical protein
MQGQALIDFIKQQHEKNTQAMELAGLKQNIR